jgi:hypothetical protein
LHRSTAIRWRFRGILPANTLVSADIIGSEYLVEIEAEALLG